MYRLFRDNFFPLCLTKASNASVIYDFLFQVHICWKKNGWEYSLLILCVLLLSTFLEVHLNFLFIE